MTILRWLFDLQIPIAGSFILAREVLGNVFGLASALGGMRRKVWAWPVGIAGNLLLLTVFLGTLFGSHHTANLWGQAGRQVTFIIVSVYGWIQWGRASRADGSGGETVVPRWAGPRVRLVLLAILFVGTALLTPLFKMLGSYDPVWADAWTFVGSLLATYGMAKAWTEFWLIWVAVDLVGVPLLFSAGYYASACMYIFYGLFTLVGFFVWLKAKPAGKPAVERAGLDPTLQPGPGAGTGGAPEAQAKAERAADARMSPSTVSHRDTP